MIWSVEFPEPKRWCIWEKFLLARQALEGFRSGAGFPGDSTGVSDPSKRPPLFMANHVPRIPFDLDKDTFRKNLRSARKGAVGPSGMTTEHLRPFLENPQFLHSFFLMCEKLSQANVVPVVL